MLMMSIVQIFNYALARVSSYEAQRVRRPLMRKEAEHKKWTLNFTEGSTREINHFHQYRVADTVCLMTSQLWDIIIWRK